LHFSIVFFATYAIRTITPSMVNCRSLLMPTYTSSYVQFYQTQIIFKCLLIKGEAVPLQAWTGPEGSRKLRFPDIVTTAQDGGKVVSLTHRPPLPPRKSSWYSFLLEVESTPRAIARSEGFYVNERCTDTSWDRNSDLPNCSTAP